MRLNQSAMKKSLAPISSVAAFLAISAATQAATVILPDNTRGMQSNGFQNILVGPGTAGGGNFQNAALIEFKVQDILTETGLTVGDLATTTFTLSFDTDASINLEAANGTPGNPGEYVITYAGFFANTGNFASAPGNPGVLSGNVASVTTGVVDTAAAQTGISGDFFLTGITEGDSGDDWIGFRVEYENPYFAQASDTIQPLSNIQLSTVPEPSAALLGCLGTILLLRRRRG